MVWTVDKLLEVPEGVGSVAGEKVCDGYLSNRPTEVHVTVTCNNKYFVENR